MKRRVTVSAAGLLLFAVSASLYLRVSAWIPPSYEEVRKKTEGSDLVLLDRWGQTLQRTRLQHASRHLGWMDLSEIAPALLTSVVHAEDRRFYAHGGVDWLALGASVSRGLAGKRMRGASTVTMQLASFVEPSLGSRKRRGLLAKLRQVKAAIQIERSWTKNEILEAYLNLASFRGELRGIAAASQGLFSTAPSNLSAAESAVLTVLLRRPTEASDQIASRACGLLKRVTKTPSIDCELVEIAAHKTEGPQQPIANPSLAPHLARHVLRTRMGFKLTTTVDAELQRFATQVLREQLSALQSQNVRDGAALVVDNASGEVLAYVGSSGAYSDTPHVDGVQAKRQAGSTLKSFLYASAFEAGWLNPSSLLEDSPVDILVERGVYRPRNHDHTFHGNVSAREALASSLNVPAVRTLLLYGPDAFVGQLERFGIKLPKTGEHYGPALALGAADISLWELVGGYRTLARGGVYGPLRFLKDKVASPIESIAVSEKSASSVSAILSDRDSRALSFGFENTLATRFWTAVKTGTSKDMRDNWCIGYSDRYTVGVWVGNNSGEPMWRVSGVTGAAPVWLDLMRHLHSDIPSQMPALVAHAGLMQSAGEPSSRRFPTVARILYPIDGTAIALDPDIPLGSERVFFEAQGDETVWRLNGRVLPANAWTPSRGRHELELLDRESKVKDRVAFLVK